MSKTAVTQSAAERKEILESALHSPAKQRRDVQRVRASLVHLARGNVDKVQMWLDQVAEGVKIDYMDDEGVAQSRYIKEPDPARALDLFFKMLKFSVPELRAVAVDMNVTGDAQPRRMSLAELEQALLEESGVIEGEVADE